jgi:hypothetical protein
VERGDALRDLGETERSVQTFGEALHTAQNDSQRCRAWIGIAGGLCILDLYNRALAALEQAEALAIEGYAGNAREVNEPRRH